LLGQITILPRSSFFKQHHRYKAVAPIASRSPVESQSGVVSHIAPQSRGIRRISRLTAPIQILGNDEQQLIFVGTFCRPF